MIANNNKQALKTFLVSSGDAALYNTAGSGNHINNVSTGAVRLANGQLGIFSESLFGSVALNVATDATPTITEAPSIYVAQGTADSAAPSQSTAAYPLVSRPYERSGTISAGKLYATKQAYEAPSTSSWILGNASTGAITASNNTTYGLTIAYTGRIMTENVNHMGRRFFVPSYTTPNYTTLGTVNPVDHLVQNMVYQINRQSMAVTANGKPSRVGKVFPDDKLVVIDDEEIVASMSWASNRNFTLPAPKVSLTPPNVCDQNNNSVGILTGSNQTMWVTYRFDSVIFDGMHCNYYQSIQGPSTGCTVSTQNVSVQFGSEFAFMNTGSTTGYSLNNFYILAQITDTGKRPSPIGWKQMNYTSDLANYDIVGAGSNNFILKTGMSSVTFVIDPTRYNAGTTYDLGTVLTLPTNGTIDTRVNFGDEYFFYGNIETEIQATIYEMRYLCNLSQNEFTYTSNPTWSAGTTSYVTEIGLFDDNRNLMAISKLQSPIQRQSIQQ